MKIDRAMLAGFFSFLACGIIYTQLTSRLPAIKVQTGISDSDVGIALMCLGGGSLVGFLTVHFVLRFMQVRTLLKISMLAFVGLCVVIGLIHERIILFIIFLLWGYAVAYLDVAMNTHGLYVEITREKTCMASMHACYSAGCLLGSAIGSFFAFFNVIPLINYLVVALIICLCFAYLQGHFVADLKHDNGKEDKSKSQDGEAKTDVKRSFVIPYFVIFCGSLGLFSYTAEGSVAEWGSLVLHQAKGASEGVAALAYGVFALFMASTRFTCDHLRSRVGDFRLMLTGTIIAFIGLSISIATSSPYICLVGYAIMGIGLAPIFPIAMSNAGRSKIVSPKAATAIVSLVGYSGLLIVPPFMGFLADFVGLNNALFLPLVAIVIVMASSFVFRQRGLGKVR